MNARTDESFRTDRDYPVLMPSSFVLTGATGRLGSVILRTFLARGDVAAEGAANYLIFAHRYRGEGGFAEEVKANVEDVITQIRDAKWAEGDCAIVMVSSVNAEVPTLDQSIAYNLSKAALNNLARFYSKSLPVRINTVSPDTFTGVKAVVTPQQVADVVAFLCSPKASGINGTDIRVTG